MRILIKSEGSWVPKVRAMFPSLTPKEVEVVAFALDQKERVDWLGAPHVQRLMEQYEKGFSPPERTRLRQSLTEQKVWTKEGLAPHVWKLKAFHKPPNKPLEIVIK